MARSSEASTLARLKWYCWLAISLKYCQNWSASVSDFGILLIFRARLKLSNFSAGILAISSWNDIIKSELRHDTATLHTVIDVRNFSILSSINCGCFVDSTTNLIPCAPLALLTRQSTTYPCCSWNAFYTFYWQFNMRVLFKGFHLEFVIKSVGNLRKSSPAS